MADAVLIRAAGADEARQVAALLDAFNREFDVPTPGEGVLAERLGRLLAGGATVALLAGHPPVGLALLTLRPNVWEAGPVGLLDELYVVPSRRSQGVGAGLLRAAEQVLRSRGGSRLEIPVDADDADARRFYEREGYRTGEQRTCSRDVG